MASLIHSIACFETLDAELTSREPASLAEILASWPSYTSANPSAPSRSADTSSAQPDDICPLFVTWNIYETPGTQPHLRGCIGQFAPGLLADALPEYAVVSAMHDSRFRPVTAKELPQLQSAVTLLTDFEECSDKFDWEIGLHGINIKFMVGGRSFSGTYLPDVMVEQAWTKEETLENLVHKAGWRERMGDWQKLDLRVQRYKGSKAKAEYSDWLAWSKWYQTQEKK
ncbi:hypothetical protein Cpir12675_001400 [Ceratocystis pirilliformis]|uniref:AMMECR1 domain-containing protein n=1 Tax=Ceratocystis pirilliformis TaxID=259994 RepID=A0ABR3ZHF6_9PEZI